MLKFFPGKAVKPSHSHAAIGTGRAPDSLSQGKAMNAERSAKLAEVDEAAAQYEGEVRDLIRRNVTALRRPQPEGNGEASNVTSLIQRVAGVSINEIEDLIAHLHDMRDYLANEGERISHEIAGYAHLSQAARTHIETMADHMVQWKAGMDGAVEERV
jgi:hypothetical protein